MLSSSCELAEMRVERWISEEERSVDQPRRTGHEETDGRDKRLGS
jgi:hypothetical protein